ncbi:MAG: hypothetical protein EOQ82_32490 [Mesorhizobium sp.]|nr:MAG: hypothetical protein EOQ82_32490 [Mesorhizobium sp.]
MAGSLQGIVATAQDAVPDDIGALRAALTAALARAEDEAARVIGIPRHAEPIMLIILIRLPPRPRKT